MPDIDTNGWMDVSAEPPRISYSATSGQTEFSIPFPFIEESDLRVYVAGVLKTLTTHYTINGEGDEAGGTVTLLTGATLGDSVVITRNLAFELTTHIPLSGILDVPAINEQFTRLMMMIQQMDADRVRSLHQPDSDEDDFDDLPAAADRASKYLAFDADGQPSMVSSVSTSVAASAFMLTLLDDLTAAAARATLGITDQSAYAGLSNWHHCR